MTNPSIPEEQPPTPSAEEVLAYTGSATMWLVIVGLLLIIAGVTLALALAKAASSPSPLED